MAFLFDVFQGLVHTIPTGPSAIDALSITSSSNVSEDHTQEEELGAGNRRLPRVAVPPAPLATTYIKRVESGKRFVDILVEAVERSTVRRNLDAHVAELQSDIDLLQKRYDESETYSEALAGRDIPQIQGILEEAGKKRTSILDSLDREWRDEYGRSYICGLKDLRAAADRDLQRASTALQATLKQIYNNAYAVIDTSRESGRMAGLPADSDFCGRLATLTACAKKLQDSERQFRERGRSSSERAQVQQSRAERDVANVAGSPRRMTAASAKLASASKQLGNAARRYEEAKRTLETQRRNQQARETAFLEGTVFPLLVTEGYLLPEQSPTLPPTPDSLERMPVMDEHGSNDQDASSVDVGPEEDDAGLISVWKRGRTSLAEYEQQYADVVEDHKRMLADHLATYGNATLDTAEQNYQKRYGKTYADREQEAWGYVEDVRRKYERVKAAAREADIEDLPLSSPDLADRTEDGYAGSASSDWWAAVEDNTVARKRRILRWGRTVARGRPRRTPQASPTWSIGSVGERKPVDEDQAGVPSNEALIARHGRKVESIRPIAERLRRDARAARVSP
ncbi:hypothetical protein LTR36_008934 [Oleoguttula mirabilis]|uniref:Uncharacterized protein n=1 Tax=Oleoguttula mirabilis TaxID=1507867 RepID=A0AAV9J7Q2_9PEZI|nr:hypothetical protein LTR36_008934 [Oleoguttula mirabilis]